MKPVNRRFTNPLATSASPTPSSFEEVVRELKLRPEEYANSPKLRAWVLRYKDEKYVPTDLLKAFGIDGDDK